MKATTLLSATGRMLSLLAVTGAASGLPVSAQTTTQTFTLQPGWNAIYLEVEPPNTAVGVVFTNVPIDSVWTFQERLSAVDFIQDPSEPVWNKSQWLVYLPTNRVESFQNNLFHLQANRAYLVNLTNAATLTVTGRPSLRPMEWAPDAYNLRGFAADPAAPPTFLEFFRHSPAHYDATRSQLQKIYRLSASGQWTLVGPHDLMVSGEAVWVYTQGGSDYTGPLAAKLAFGDGLDYARELVELPVLLLNRTDGPRHATISAPTALPLSYLSFNPTNGHEWLPLPASLTISNLSAANGNLRLAIRRQDFTGTEYGAVLTLSDGAGTRFLVAVSAEKESFGGAGGRITTKSIRQHANPPAATASYAGLWLGSAVVNAVNEANTANPANPTPTKSDFKLRLLIHVDTNGMPRLLKEVLQMWKEGTYTNDANGDKVVDQPGRYVLLTDETLISQYHGATVRDGAEVGRRLSTVGFDFSSSAPNNFLVLAGQFGIGHTLDGAITLTPDFATNPFKHKYHPDHDNLDATFQNYRAEAYEVTRAFALVFTASDPAGATAPDYGYGVLAGNYLETIIGLHKNPLIASGTFRLTRVAMIGVLNQ
ncbi:MAG: hypothetical protein AAB676_17100 [Verrucomicrobiota bacterium]